MVAAFTPLTQYLDDPREVFKLREEQERRKTVKEKILEILLDGKPHSNRDLVKVTHRFSARIKDLRDEGWIILSWRDEEDPATWWYQLVGRDSK